MSLLGTLEQFRLPNVLERVESHEKTGLLVVRQGALWVEFYFRNGCLLCIGPVRTSATLGDRLLQDKVISQQVWQEMKGILGSDEQSETRVAITLMERMYVTREQLRAWTTEKVLAVLSAVLSWTSGEVYFEESTQPPSDRLLVSMSIASLINTANVNIPAPQTQRIQATPAPSKTVKLNGTQGPASFVPPLLPSTPSLSVTTSVSSLPAFKYSKTPKTPTTTPNPKVDITRVPTLMEADQFLDKTGLNPTKTSNTTWPETEYIASVSDGNNDPRISAPLPNTNEISFASLALVDAVSENKASIQPEIMKYPVTPKRIDTSFMQPTMVLVPADISAFREQNPKVQITSDQWRVLTCVDGHNSLQMACQLLGLLPDAICALAGELVAEGLIRVIPPEQVQLQEPARNTRDLSVSDLTNTYVAPGYTASSAAPWSAAVPALPSTDTLSNTSTALLFETESQWGNGGNGATFIPGRGWVMISQSSPPSGPLASTSGVYAQSR